MQVGAKRSSPGRVLDAAGSSRKHVETQWYSLAIASAARTLRLKAGLNDDLGRDGARDDAADDS